MLLAVGGKLDLVKRLAKRRRLTLIHALVVHVLALAIDLPALLVDALFVDCMS
jgi:hypothetical protein